MNIYLQNTGKNTKNTWIQQQSFEEYYLYIYQTTGEDWKIVHDTATEKQTEILSTFNDMRWTVFCG